MYIFFLFFIFFYFTNQKTQNPDQHAFTNPAFVIKNPSRNMK